MPIGFYALWRSVKNDFGLPTESLEVIIVGRMRDDAVASLLVDSKSRRMWGFREFGEIVAL